MEISCLIEGLCSAEMVKIREEKAPVIICEERKISGMVRKLIIFKSKPHASQFYVCCCRREPDLLWICLEVGPMPKIRSVA